MTKIHNLNEKGWYRFLKVFSFLVTLLAIIGSGVAIYENNGGIKTINANKTIVTCNFLSSPEPFSLSSIDLDISKEYFNGNSFNYESYFGGYYTDYDIKKIWKECKKNNPDVDMDAIDGLDIIVMQRFAEILRSDQSEEFKNMQYTLDGKLISSAYTKSEKVKHLDFSFKAFDIEPSYSYTKTILTILGATAGILIVFEIIRRVFYYIVLGSFRPKKNESNNLS